MGQTSAGAGWCLWRICAVTRRGPSGLPVIQFTPDAVSVVRSSEVLGPTTT